MRKLTTIMFVFMALGSPARAAPVDMSTQTCQDWIDASEDEQELMVAWLRGYVAGRSTSSLYNLSNTRADAALLRLYCQNHHAIGLTSAASQWKN